MSKLYLRLLFPLPLLLIACSPPKKRCHAKPKVQLVAPIRHTTTNGQQQITAVFDGDTPGAKITLQVITKTPLQPGQNFQFKYLKDPVTHEPYFMLIGDTCSSPWL